MMVNRSLLAGAAVAVALASSTLAIAAEKNAVGTAKIKHVLLLSIDGMHAADFYNCSHGIANINGGDAYCPNLAALSATAVNYVAASSSKPSDSFPGLAALVTGGSPKTTGMYYDVSYDRSLAPPAKMTGTGLAGGTCTAGVYPGTTTDYDQGIALDDTKLNGGAPGALPVEGGIASIDPGKLVRNPAAGCAPVYPWDFVRVNTIFSVVHAAGGYTAWIDKHASYSFVAGPGGKGLDDYYSPEVDSTVIALPGISTATGVSCATVPDPAGTSAWNSSFANIQCYDALKVKGLLNQIAGGQHNTAPGQVPTLFGMNFQAVYVGESVYEPGVGNGGYKDAAATPSAELLKEVEFVDASIGQIVAALKTAGLYDSTEIIVTAKHGESSIDPSRYVADGANTPATLLATAGMIPASESPLTPGGIGATEDDVSVLWLNKGASVLDAVNILEENATPIGLGQIYYGPTLALNYGMGGLAAGDDPRTPDIIVTPNVGVTYSGNTTMIGDHGGFAHDDTNVMLLVEHPSFFPRTVYADTTTRQVAPTILQSLGLAPTLLDAVNLEGTAILPGIPEELSY
jgi:hypothetical protein